MKKTNGIIWIVAAVLLTVCAVCNFVLVPFDHSVALGIVFSLAALSGFIAGIITLRRIH
jgi:hypothetical protein